MTKPPEKSKVVRKLRCAVYTRKSSEEGLEQEFNSLHAQSPTRITPENNGIIRPQLDGENAFARASGGGDGSSVKPSLVAKALIKRKFAKH